MADHHWHVEGPSQSTLMSYNNWHAIPVRCCHCGRRATQFGRDEWFTPEGCGPHHREERFVVDRIEDVMGAPMPSECIPKVVMEASADA